MRDAKEGDLALEVPDAAKGRVLPDGRAVVPVFAEQLQRVRADGGAGVRRVHRAGHARHETERLGDRAQVRRRLANVKGWGLRVRVQVAQRGDDQRAAGAHGVEQRADHGARAAGHAPDSGERGVDEQRAALADAGRAQVRGEAGSRRRCVLRHPQRALFLSLLAIPTTFARRWAHSRGPRIILLPYFLAILYYIIYSSTAVAKLTSPNLKIGAAMIGTLALLASWTAGAARASHCVDRQRGCSGHGECVRGGVSCKCDPLFHGDRCDVWRSAPSADLTELQNVDWINCTHGRSTNGTGVDQHCDFENKSVCEAAGAPTVPQTCANMFLICDYTGCYSKPFCEGFLPPGYTPPGRNPQPYHCFCPNGGTDQNTMSRPTTIPGVPGVMCAPPCEEGGQACCGSFQRDHRFHTPLPILAKPQVCADQNDRRTAVSASSILRLSRQARNSDANADSFVCCGTLVQCVLAGCGDVGSMCVLTCDPSIPQENGCGPGPGSPTFNATCATNCQRNQECFAVPVRSLFSQFDENDMLSSQKGHPNALL